MGEERSIVSYHIGEYGRIVLKLAELMDSRNITRNRLSVLTGVKYPTVDHYYKAKSIERLDLDFLAKVCYVLDCRVEDILEYEKPEEILNDPQNTLED